MSFVCVMHMNDLFMVYYLSSTACSTLTLCFKHFRFLYTLRLHIRALELHLVCGRLFFVLSFEVEMIAGKREIRTATLLHYYPFCSTTWKMNYRMGFLQNSHHKKLLNSFRHYVSICFLQQSAPVYLFAPGIQ